MEKGAMFNVLLVVCLLGQEMRIKIELPPSKTLIRDACDVNLKITRRSCDAAVLLKQHCDVWRVLCPAYFSVQKRP